MIVQILWAIICIIGAIICVTGGYALIVIVADMILPQKETPKHIVVRTSDGTVLGYLKSWNWKTNTFSVTQSKEEAKKFYDEPNPCEPYTLDGMILHLNTIYKNQLFLPYTFVRSEGNHKW